MTETFRVDPAAIGHIWPALDVLRAACGEVGVGFVVVGAAARDLLLEHVYGVRRLRATKDVDAAVAVRGWEEYEAVIGQLVGAHGFERAREHHRVRRDALVVDVVPFGEIAAGTSHVEWPGATTAMSVLGYQEAYEAAVGIAADAGPPVRVASLPGVGVLKLVAWGEAPHRRAQDPVDLCAIMTSYDGVVGDRLYVDHADLLEEEPFDLRVASSRVYGRDMAPLLRTAELRDTLLRTLEANTRDGYDSRLALAMGSVGDPDYAFRLRCLRALRQGISDGLHGATAAPIT